MKFSIGDKIILKHIGEEGVVTSYINEQMLEVEVNDTKFPVYVSDIDHPYLKWFTEKKQTRPKTLQEQLPVEKQNFEKAKLPNGVSLSFLPVYKQDILEDEVQALKVYLVNELPKPVYFQYKVISNKQELIFAHEGKLHKYAHLYLHTMDFDMMNEQPRFYWEVQDAESSAIVSHEGVLRIKPSKLFQQIQDMLKNNEAMFSYLLIDDVKPAVVKNAIETEKKAKVIPAIAPSVEKGWKAALPHFEIDLHLESLISDIRGLNNADKLHIQLGALKTHLDSVIRNKQERTVIIHGLGKGVLKDEVHKILREVPEVSKFSNDWHGRYGFGATEVWFKY